MTKIVVIDQIKQDRSKVLCQNMGTSCTPLFFCPFVKRCLSTSGSEFVKVSRCVCRMFLLRLHNKKCGMFSVHNTGSKVADSVSQTHVSVVKPTQGRYAAVPPRTKRTWIASSKYWHSQATFLTMTSYCDETTEDLLRQPCQLAHVSKHQTPS